MENETTLVKCVNCEVLTLKNITLDGKPICPSCLFHFVIARNPQNCIHGVECRECEEMYDYARGM